jgi:hypothetical protein
VIGGESRHSRAERRGNADANGEKKKVGKNEAQGRCIRMGICLRWDRKVGAQTKKEAIGRGDNVGGEVGRRWVVSEGRWICGDTRRGLSS